MLRSQSVEIEVLGFEVSVVTETYAKRTIESVNEEIKELVFVDFTVCLLVILDHISASRLFTFRLCEVLKFGELPSKEGEQI